MSIASVIRETLEADGALMALLTGGVYSGISEITRQSAPGAFDANAELRPCALVKLSDTTAAPVDFAGEQLVGIWVYHRDSDEQIYIILDRIYMLLHRRNFGGGMFECRWAFDNTSLQDEALNARMGVTRFTVPRNRG